MFGQPVEMLRRGAQGFGRTLTNLRHNLVVQVGDDLFHFLFHARCHAAELFVELAAKRLKAGIGCWSVFWLAHWAHLATIGIVGSQSRAVNRGWTKLNTHVPVGLLGPISSQFMLKDVLFDTLSGT
jgi:hypothetical protein